MKPKQPLRLLLFSLVLIAWRDSSHASTDQASPTLFQTFVQKGYSEMILELNFDALLENRKLEEEHKGSLRLLSPTNEEMEMQVKIKPRGVFRRYNCDIPPLRFNFSKNELEALGVATEFDKLKLVAPCLDQPESLQQLLKEYWAYQLYHELTLVSFQVHLVKITYVNTGTEKFERAQMAFFLESKDELAERLGGVVVEQYGLTSMDVEASSYQHTMLFNNMIGNQDWELEAQRNVTFIQLHETASLLVVPYDFDYSAWVNPSYLPQYEQALQQGINGRVFVGEIESVAALSETIAHFQDAQEQLLATFQDADLLSKKHKKAMTKYLKDFFTIVGDEQKLGDMLL